MRTLNEEEKELLYRILRSRETEPRKAMLISQLINKTEPIEKIKKKCRKKTFSSSSFSISVKKCQK